jgi:soluble lytic murein transglycosylase
MRGGPSEQSRNHSLFAVYRRVAAVAALLLVWAAADAGAGPLESQRALFRATRVALERGNSAPWKRARAALRDYPLSPYLELLELQRRLATLPFADVDAFLKQHDRDLPAVILREKWLTELAARSRWAEYLRYDTAEDNAQTASRRCTRAWALWNIGDVQQAAGMAAAIWLSPQSLPSSCDGLFEAWYKRGNPPQELAWQRFEQATLAGNVALANYLVHFLDANHRSDAALYAQLRDQPTRVLESGRFSASNPRHAPAVAYGLSRLAIRDAKAARDALERYRKSRILNDAAARIAAPRIASAIAAESAAQAAQWVIGLQISAQGSTLGEEAARYAIRAHDWPLINQAVQQLPPELAELERWKYWQTRTAEALGAAPGEDAISDAYRQLRTTRSYYGFLAAERIGEKPEMQNQPVAVDESLRRATEQLPVVRRTRERLLLGETAAAQREWQYALGTLDNPQLQALAKLATEWGWYQQAILALIASQQINDLELRFPLSYASEFTRAAQRQRIDASWLYAIARQESMFNPSIRSSAGAVGLMQLMPMTAQQTARRAGIPYSGPLQLVNPGTNVTLGSHYMRMMLDDFQQNRILAAAAYNAGPNRVRQWLRRLPERVEHDMFVESIPFPETRQYVQNVLSFAVIYAWLQGRSAPLVFPGETVIRNSRSGTG